MGEWSRWDLTRDPKQVGGWLGLARGQSSGNRIVLSVVPLACSVCCRRGRSTCQPRATCLHPQLIPPLHCSAVCQDRHPLVCGCAAAPGALPLLPRRDRQHLLVRWVERLSSWALAAVLDCWHGTVLLALLWSATSPRQVCSTLGSTGACGCWLLRLAARGKQKHLPVLLALLMWCALVTLSPPLPSPPPPHRHTAQQRGRACEPGAALPAVRRLVLHLHLWILPAAQQRHGQGALQSKLLPVAGCLLAGRVELLWIHAERLQRGAAADAVQHDPARPAALFLPWVQEPKTGRAVFAAPVGPALEDLVADSLVVKVRS